MKTKIMLSFVISLIFFSILRLSAHAQPSTVLKAKLPYEILSIEVNNNILNVSGWAFINHTQHFLNQSTHEISILFQSKTHQFQVMGNLTNIDLTESMQYRGAPTCANNVYFREPSTCNYNYKNVGFKVSVNINQFKKEEIYQAYIVVKAKQANTNYKIQAYYPISKPVTYKNGDYLLQVKSALKDTSLVINHSNVVVRKGPTTQYETYKLGNACNTTYKNQLFYKEGSRYDVIYEKLLINNVSVYKIRGKLDVCFDKRRRVVEGNDINPMYIASTFVEYGGESLSIVNQLVNTAPVLTVKHPTIYLNDPFNYKDYVSAYDAEEKDLTANVRLITSNYKNQVGKYQMVFYVEDKHKAFDQKTMNITVLGPLNEPPTIVASDKVIKQYDAFNPLHDVFAYDKEDGNITHKIKTSNVVNTNVAGVFKQCYSVKDSHQAEANACINVTVVEREKIYHYRFIRTVNDKEVHASWQADIKHLKQQIVQNDSIIAFKAK